MTRRAGVVPVKLARTRATALAEALGNLRFPEPTILGSAGLSAAELAAQERSTYQAIECLCAHLMPAVTGRKRMPVSVYYLERSTLALLDSGFVALQLATDTRLTLRHILRASRRRRGPIASERLRARNIKNDTYAPETIRRYNWEAKKRAAFEREFERSLETNPLAEGPLSPVLIPLAAHRWLV